jgi:hypothetical protein
MENELFLAQIDIISNYGTVEGWAIDGDTEYPCHIQVRLENTIIAEDIANKFRLDLLETGLGHGHYAFYAPIRTLSPGIYPLRLFDGKTGLPIGNDEERLIEVPSYAALPKKTIETLLSCRKSWQDEDIVAHPACLQIEQNFVHFGPKRFIDRVFRFALGRWADPAAIMDYSKLLTEQKMTPTENLLAVLRSSERQAQDRRLSRPGDPDFPFVYNSEAAVRAFLEKRAADNFPVDLDL